MHAGKRVRIDNQSIQQGTLSYIYACHVDWLIFIYF